MHDIPWRKSLMLFILCCVKTMQAFRVFQFLDEMHLAANGAFKFQRDPFLLMLLLMGRHPGMLIPDDVDASDYEVCI